MSEDDKESESSGKLLFSIDSRGIYSEASESYRVWKNSDTKESLGYLGVDKGVHIKGGIFSHAHFTIGTNYVYEGNRERTPDIEFKTNLYFSDGVKYKDNNGYINDKSVNGFQKLLEDQGFENLKFISNDYYRFFQMELAGKVYRLEIGDPDLESNIKKWEEFKIGPKPDRNHFFSLTMQTKTQNSENDRGFPITEQEYDLYSHSLLEATGKVIQASDEYFSAGKSSADISFESQKTRSEDQRIKLGFSVTDYSEGEFGPDGESSERVYSELDNLLWNRKQDKITEWRCLGNRQILTMHKDRLVFGRWGSIEASRNGTQADVLIDEDINPDSQKVMQ